MNSDKYYKLSNQPLIFVLAEFRFTEIMSMANYVSKIQETLRHSYPFLEEQHTQEVNITNEGLEINQSPQWALIGKNKLNAIVLDSKRLVFVTSDYQRFEDFQAKCEEVLKVLIEFAKPTLLTRVGLRYADLIISKSDNMDVCEYVQSSIFGNSFLNEIGNVAIQTNETTVETNEGVMTARSMHGKSNLSTWPDIVNLPIKLASQNEVSERIILDFDHVWQSNTENPISKTIEEALDFDINLVLEKLAKMHKLNRQAFWDSTTKQAKEIWK